MLTRSLNNNQVRKMLEVAGNKSGAIVDLSNLFCDRIGAYGGCNGLYYSQKEVGELLYAFWRMKREYEMEAVANEIYDMWYK